MFEIVSNCAQKVSVREGCQRQIKLCGEICLGFLRDEGMFWAGGGCSRCACLVHLQPESSSSQCMLRLCQQDCPALVGLSVVLSPPV